VRPIATERELAALADRLRAEPLLAVDTEAARCHRYL
jgi:ribonuclease D